MTINDNKESRATGAAVPNIKWDEIDAHIYRPDVCSVRSTREELSFLFGSYAPEVAGGAEMSVKMQKRIIVSPFVAKRLANLLRDTLQDYESQYGSLNEESSTSTKQSGSPSLTAHPSSDRAGMVEQGQMLFQHVNNLGLIYGYERSFKMYAKTLLGNRFLLSLDSNSLRQWPSEKIREFCRQINMPEALLAGFSEDLPRARCVHFGFEENKTSRIYKAYLEFSPAGKGDVNNGTCESDPFLLYLGFKWDTADNTKQAVSRYTRYPFITVENILERVPDIYGGAGCPYEVVKGITDIASSRTDGGDIFYLEVAEDNNPRRSFDINMYSANLVVGELYPLLARIGQHYAISFENFHGLYEGIKDRIFGHVSGGIDREGKDFLTIYHGMQTLQKQDDESPRSQKRQLSRIRSHEPQFSGAESRDLKAFKLFELVKELKVPFGTEYSFKAMNKTLLPDRCLIGIQPESITQRPDDIILNICRQIEMPEPFQEMFREHLSKAKVVLFGFEKNRKNVFFKAYLEFGRKIKGFEEDSNNPESFLMHLAFKWNITDDAQRAVAKYRCFPNLTDKEILERVSSQNFLGDERKGCLGIVKDILNLAVCRTHPFELLYLETEEEGNPRKSFNIKTFNADLRMKEVYPYLVEISRYFSIPEEEYRKAYDPVKNLIFANIQTGIDRAGKEFFTVYFSEKGSPKKHRK